MTCVEPQIEQYRLSLDTVATVEALATNAETPWGRRLHDALCLALCADPCFVLPPYVTVRQRDFQPGAPERNGYPDVSHSAVTGVLDALRASGYITTERLLYESSSASYLSDDRAVTVVRVLRPFVLLDVDYECGPSQRYSPASQRGRWEIADRSSIVPAGTYLLIEAGDFRPGLVGVVGTYDRDGDQFVSWLYDCDGFSASRCDAECDACGGSWYAEAGSWHFHADTGDRAWEFDDAADFRSDGTIACPGCATGRVAFLIS